MTKNYWCPFCKTKLRLNPKHSNRLSYFCKCNDKTNYDGCYNWETNGDCWEYWQQKDGWVRLNPKFSNGFVFR